MKCALCKTKECSRGVDCTTVREQVTGMYKDGVLEVARAAAHVEATYYMQKTRIEEVIEFAKLMGYKRIGIAFCVGLSAEAERIHEILERHFEVSSVCCKVCGIPKGPLGMKSVSGEDDETMCNPVGQATVLNGKKTDVNLIVGLCVGHDMLFTRHSEAPVSTLIAKDRVLSHNPAGAIYSRYYIRRLTG